MMERLKSVLRNPWVRYGGTSAVLTLFGVLAVANFGDQQKDIAYVMNETAAVGTPVFERSVENLLGPVFAPGNRVTSYQNGDEIFPAMLASIRAAKETINFESYIYVSGRTGDRFVEALAERARAGVKVHLLIDWLGSEKVEDRMIDTLRSSGVEVNFFHPLGWFTITRLNNRTHRKLLIIDGRTGFTGGVGIADAWLGNGRDPDRWRDSQFKVEGPVVAQFQAAFADDWIATSPNVLQGELYFPKLRPVGASKAQMFKSAPREGAASAELLYLLAIQAARREILLQYAYFVPGELALRAFHEAVKRGVKIKLIVPGKYVDSRFIRLASRAKWGRLLEEGVEIYEFRPAMYHVKAMIVDDEFVSVGSTNFDDRSFRLNYEASLNVVDKEFARSMHRVFLEDLAVSDRITLADWKNRPRAEKILGSLVSLVSNQL